MSLLAIKNNFKLRVQKSNKDLYSMWCIQSSCEWVVCATRTKGCDIFMMSKCTIEDTCSTKVLNHDHRWTNAFVIGNISKEKFGVGRDDCLRHIIDEMWWRFGVNTDYDKAWHVRKTTFAFARGTSKESYALLHAYGETLKIESTRIVFEIKLEDNEYIKYVFMTLGLS